MSASSPPLSIGVRSVDDLLDAAGSPLLEPRIHPEAARALEDQAGDHRRAGAFSITVTVPEDDAGRQGEVETAVQRHFQAVADTAAAELAELGRKGRINLLIALAVVAVFIGLSEAVLHLGEGRFVSVLSESLVIIAWVTLWGPAETLLFARFPVSRRRTVATALSRSRVRLQARSERGS
jgi:hypothetical protein